jgi:hypothetical protein
LGDALMVLGSIYRHAGDQDAANDTFAKARAVMASRASEAPDDPARQARLAVALTREAESLVDKNQTDPALELLDEAVKIGLKLAAISAAPEHARERLSESLWERARILRTLGESGDADKLDVERKALWNGRAPKELVALAGEEASRATLIGYGKTAMNPHGGAVRQRGLDQAATNLRLAITLGYSELGKLRSDPRYAPLLSRDDIGVSLMDMAFPAWPFDHHR